MELNGTWYAIDTIKVVEKVVFNSNKFGKSWELGIVIFIGNYTTREYIYSKTQAQAEQSRKELIKQLEK